MSREEFLNELRLALQGYISQGKVNEHLRYYENYIIEESRKGKTEEEVLASLGNPRLIAKTIIETEGVSQRIEPEETKDTADSKQLRNKIIHIKSGVAGWVILLVIVLLFILAAKILTALLPILLPLLVIGIVIYLFNFGKK